MWQIEGVLTKAADELQALQEERRVWHMLFASVICFLISTMCLHTRIRISLRSTKFSKYLLRAVCLCAGSGCSNCRRNRCFFGKA